MDSNANLSKGKVFLGPTIIMIVLGTILFLPAGSFRYWEGWIYWSETFLLVFFTPIYFLKKNPAFISRRSKFKEKEQQPAFIRALSLLYTFGYVIPGLDYRFHWSDVPFLVVLAANAVIFLSYVFIFFVFKENSYASTIIQVETEQKVIKTGPYSKVRHPMYTALVLISLSTPFALGSYWAFITFVLIIPTLVFRILQEEALLMRELPGYKDYCLMTPYRLIPMIW